jgi:alginate O-acetyltransferase complex protein AlgI
MSFTEVEFLYFMPLVFALYWLLPRACMPQNACLLIASVIFYASWSLELLALLAVGTCIDFLVIRRLTALESLEHRARERRAWLALSILASVGALAFFKYERFFATEADRLLSYVGLPPVFPVLEIALPIGISYYTLQRVGYVLDVYWRRLAATPSPLNFATFVMFFPQITAGPISRGSELMPQLAAPRQLLPSGLQAACGAFLLGFFLKAWVARSLTRCLLRQQRFRRWPCGSQPPVTRSRCSRILPVTA